MDYKETNVLAALKRHRFKFSHSLGQNFILDEKILEKIADCAEISPADNIVEIGAGAGTLTGILCRRAKKVLAFEIDKALSPILSEQLKEFSNLKIIFQDIMKADIAALASGYFGGEAFSVVANLPYYITTPILMMLLESDLPLNGVTVLVQKEVAERIAASEGCKDYGALTIAVQYRMEAKIAMMLPSSAFFPPPKVDSAVVSLKKRAFPPVDAENEEMFFKVVRAAFAMRRKTMANNLRASFGLDKEAADELISCAGCAPQVRGESLGMAQMALLSNLLSKRGKDI